MKEENEQKLFNKFPDLLPTNLGIESSLIAFGIECGDGWFQILWDLCEKITAVCRDNDIKIGPEDLHVNQIKEKYAGLRFYTSSCCDCVNQLIKDAEELCEKTCELCGEPGKVHGQAWIYTRCEKCWGNRN